MKEELKREGVLKDKQGGTVEGGDGKEGLEGNNGEGGTVEGGTILREVLKIEILREMVREAF